MIVASIRFKSHKTAEILVFYYSILSNLISINGLVGALDLPYCCKLEMHFDIPDRSFDHRDIFLREESSNLETFLNCNWRSIIVFLHAVSLHVYVEFKSY